MIAILMGCNPAVQKTDVDKPLSYHRMSYAQLFGIATFDGYEQLFYLNGNDTIWSLKSTELPQSGMKVAVLSSVFAGFIEELGLQNSIIAVDNDKYFNDSQLVRRIKNGEISSVGEEGQLQIEKLLGLKPDLLITSSFGFNNQSLKTRLKHLNIHMLMCDNFKEQHPLARAEWIKFFGFLYHQSQMADSIFVAIENNYKSIRNSTPSRQIKPKVMTDAMYSEVWNVPGGNSYSARLIEDAGAEYIFMDKKELYTYPLNLESVLKATAQADYWIHVNQFRTQEEMLKVNSRYALFRPFMLNHVYNNNKRENAFGGNDFWEKGAVRADLVLRDLVYIFSADKISSDKLYFYTLVD